MKRTSALLLLLLLTWCPVRVLFSAGQLPAAAVETGAPAVPEPGTATAAGDVIIRSHSPNGISSYDQKRHLGRISGDVHVTQEGEDFILYADEVMYDEKNQLALARVGLRVETRSSTINGDQLRASFVTRQITISGHVTMKAHGAGDGIHVEKPVKTPTPSGPRRPVQISCDKLDYNYGTHQAVLSGGITVHSGDMTAVCDQITYDEARNIAELRGNVRFSNGPQQTIRAPSLTVWLDQDMVKATRPELHIVPDHSTPQPGTTPAPSVNFGEAPQLPEDVVQAFATPLPEPGH